MFGKRRKETAHEGNTVQHGSPQPDTAPTAPKPPPLALDLSNEAQELFISRQFTAAIPVYRQAIDVIRRSPKVDHQAVQALLGMDLCLLAGCLSQTGSIREALAAAEESAAILTAVSGPDALLTRSLETVALCLDSLAERPEDKAAAAMRAAALLARAGDSAPNSLRRRHVMLNGAANVLNNSGDAREALRLRAEAIGVIEAMAEADPAHRHRLAAEYASLAVLHAKLGEFAEASVAADTCAASMSDPEFTAPAAERLVIAGNLSVFAHRLVENAHRTEALRPFVLAIDLFRGLRSDAPEPVEFKLAHCLNEHAWNLCVLGEQDEALPCAEEAVELLRATVESKPAQRLLICACLDTLATALAMSGRKDAALAACSEALDIRRELAEADREKYQAELASTEKLQARIMGRESGSFTER